MKDPLWMLLEEKGRVVHSVPPDTTVVEAVKTMNAHRAGAVLVAEQGEPIGIFTERDAPSKPTSSRLLVLDK